MPKPSMIIYSILAGLAPLLVLINSLLAVGLVPGFKAWTNCPTSIEQTRFSFTHEQQALRDQASGLEPQALVGSHLTQLEEIEKTIV